MAAFVNSYSFSHRFSGATDSDYAGYQEIIHQCQEVNATGLTRQYFQFALGCGYSPRNIIDAFENLAAEYNRVYYGYNEEKNERQ